MESLSRDDVETLEVPFTNEEIVSTLNSMNENKALGLNGFTMAFWQHYWDFVKLVEMGFFKEFYEFESFERSLNTTFLVLIPKKGKGRGVEGFQAYKLASGSYKLPAKVLANRLKKVVKSIVSNSHNVFVEGRQILDAVLITNEVIDSNLKNGLNSLMCKLDIEMAYDHVL